MLRQQSDFGYVSVRYGDAYAVIPGQPAGLNPVSRDDWLEIPRLCPVAHPGCHF
jgi:hypothetical protein